MNFDSISLLVKRLQYIRSPWAVVGGSNLFIRGICDQATDVDIVTSESGVIEIKNALPIFNSGTLPLERTKCEKVSSIFFTTEVDNCIVEVMGAPHNYIGGKWVPNIDWEASIEFCSINNGLVVPLTSLEYEMKINMTLGNSARTKIIKRYLTRAPR
ncbi:hypothetical protein [Shewanella vaxholmensis]|uniref:hypothetical protein n=1 Tax=Shewanella vaxholmensis TaxID=3063535 RepID=UPI00288D2619|nr:hypothetical protein [Shewanella sp. SP1S1-4]MDT3309548.1 hypothetical protein [Shewanella sp. SP1S1-4]